MPRLDMFPYDGRIPKEEKLRRTVEDLLRKGRAPADAVIALTDVYTGTSDFSNATDAKQKMRMWVGQNDKFHPHAAPPGQPETVNHNRPPSFHIREIFRIGICRDDYSKPRDGNRILRDKDLAIAAAQCLELKAFLNTILTLSGGAALS